MTDKLALTPCEVAELLGVSRPTVYQLCQRKEFPAFHVGRKVLISADGLRQWIQDQTGGLYGKN